MSTGSCPGPGRIRCGDGPWASALAGPGRVSGAYRRIIGASRLSVVRGPFDTRAMKRFTDLRVLFTIVAVLELVYAVAGVLTPPGMVRSVTGWVLSADGQWVAKLLGVALASQAWIAWMFRNHPHLGVAKALALYQLGSATADWV